MFSYDFQILDKMLAHLQDISIALGQKVTAQPSQPGINLSSSSLIFQHATGTL